MEILIVLALIATVIVLFVGILSMGFGGNNDSENSNLYMRMRVAFQTFALCLIAFTAAVVE